MSHDSEARKLGAVLRELREEARLRQYQVARKMRHRQSWVSRYERGERVLDLFELRVLCRVLGVSVRHAVERIEKGLED